MSDDTTIVARWNGQSFDLRPQHKALVSRMVNEGDGVILEISTPRNLAEHRAYFAEIARYFGSIPEQLEEMPFASNIEAFRKHALIATGYADTQSIDCGSKAAAERIAHRLRSIGDYAVVSVRGQVVMHAVARSQSVRAMPNGEFKKSKRDVLDWMASICGVTEAA